MPHSETGKDTLRRDRSRASQAGGWRYDGYKSQSAWSSAPLSLAKGRHVRHPQGRLWPAPVRLHRRSDPKLRCNDPHAGNISSDPWRDAQGSSCPAPPPPLDRELHVDYFTVVGLAAGDQDAITNKVQEGADPQTLLDNRHLVLRVDKASSIMK